MSYTMHQKAFSHASRSLIRPCMPPRWEKEMIVHAFAVLKKKKTYRKQLRYSEAKQDKKVTH